MRLYLAVCLLALILPGVAPAQILPPAPPPTGATPQKITPVRLTSHPTAEDIERFYPPLAIRLSLQGEAVIGCTIGADAKPAECTALGETPPGFGFGKQAVQMARTFTFTPRTTDGTPVAGRWATRIAFQMDAGDDGHEAAPPTFDRLDPTRVSAATALADQMHLNQVIGAAAERQGEAIDASCRSGGYANCEPVHNAFRAQIAPAIANGRALMIRVFAARFNEGDLHSAMAYFRGMGSDDDQSQTAYLNTLLGRMQEGRSERFTEALRQINAHIAADLDRGFRRTYCQATGCPPLSRTAVMAYLNGDPAARRKP